MGEKVVDASVVLAVLGGESGAPDPSAFGADYSLSTVNLAEVVSKLSERGLPDHSIERLVETLGVTVVAFDRSLAMRAGKLRLKTREHGLSLGDRACLALALQNGAPALTADPAWATVEVGVQIELIR
jgi:PIN domain nuclease of toxin-antitoxin system